jgi:hypothetical protein
MRIPFELLIGILNETVLVTVGVLVGVRVGGGVFVGENMEVLVGVADGPAVFVCVGVFVAPQAGPLILVSDPPGNAR